MPAAMPIEAQKYYVSGSIPETIRNLTAAAEEGEFGFEVIARFIRLVEKGLEPRFMKTRSIPLAIKEAIEANPDREPRQVVYQGYAEGLWQLADVEAFEENAQALSTARRPQPQRGVYLTRKRRNRPLRPNTEGAFVPKMALDAVCDQFLCDGAKATLALIMSRAGRDNVLVTYTTSLASQIGRTSRTVRNHLSQLEEAGLIRREAGRHPNTVRIIISSRCRPAPYEEPADIAAYKKLRKSPDPAHRAVASMIAALGNSQEQIMLPSLEERGRKEISAFNPNNRVFNGGALTSEFDARSRYAPPTTHSRLLRKQTPHKLSHLPLGTSKYGLLGGQCRREQDDPDFREHEAIPY